MWDWVCVCVCSTIIHPFSVVKCWDFMKAFVLVSSWVWVCLSVWLCHSSYILFISLCISLCYILPLSFLFSTFIYFSFCFLSLQFFKILPSRWRFLGISCFCGRFLVSRRYHRFHFPANTHSALEFFNIFFIFCFLLLVLVSSCLTWLRCTRQRKVFYYISSFLMVLVAAVLHGLSAQRPLRFLRNDMTNTGKYVK